MKKPPAVTVIDFETLPIEDRPRYPPVPVGMSIKEPSDKKAKYYAWGHPTENNCGVGEAKSVLQRVWNSKTPLLFHHAKFDVDVAQTHLQMGDISWDRVHDTMYLLFLCDPHAPDFKLKPSSERILGLPPEEQDAVQAWVMEHKREIAHKYGYDVKPSTWGGAIAYAPGGLVGTYANGDTLRTDLLFKHCWPRVAEAGMLPAYDRERELMPIFLANERRGMRVDVAGLERDIPMYQAASEAADAWLRKRLKAKDLNLDSDAEVAVALSNAGIVDDDQWELTATGRRSVSKKNLRPDMYNDPRVAAAFGYRNRLNTCLNMFMLPWLAQAQARKDHHISTNWNQVRQNRAGAKDTNGTRTGRPSCSDPNFLNLSKTWHDKDDGYSHPDHIKGLAELPLVRSYVLPDKNEVFVHRDFNGQELRILGHFEDGALMQAYQENPRMDVHDFVKGLISDIAGLDYHRTQVKITNFRRIYGGGVPATAGALNITHDKAKQLLDAHGKALPGVKDLDKQIKAMAKAGDPITTWGGREYYQEEPKYSEKFKRMMTFDYKLLNYLIQGSAADATKEAIIRHHNHPKREARFLVTVYDEINISAAKKRVKEEMAILRECMEGLEFDVPMLSDGKTGPNWGALTKYVD